jgi:hypothetical protein
MGKLTFPDKRSSSSKQPAHINRANFLAGNLIDSMQSSSRFVQGFLDENVLNIVPISAI